MTTSKTHGSAVLCGAVTLLICIGVIYGTPRDTYWIADCGHKALVTTQLLESGYGQLNFDYPAAAFDSSMAAGSAGSGFPIQAPFAVPRGDGYTSVWPPSYPALAAPFLAVLGPAGTRLPAALGLSASALLMALWLTPAVGKRTAFAGGLVLALATPLFFYGVTVWEHTLTVALCLGAWLAMSRDSARGVLGAGLLVGLACCFREELALMGAALAGASLLHRRSLRDPALLAAGAALPIAALAVFNGAAYGNPLGLHLAGTLLPEVGGSHIATNTGLWLYNTAWSMAGLWSGIGYSGAEGAVLGLAALASLGIGLRAASATAASAPSALSSSTAPAASGRTVRPALLGSVVLIGVASWTLGFAQLWLRENPLEELVHYNGLLIRLPLLCLVGLGLRPALSEPRWAPLRVGLTAGLLFGVAAILLGATTRYSAGIHWGPRHLSPAFPAIVAVAIAATRGSGGAPAPRLLRASWLLLASLGLASSTQASWLLYQQKTEGQRLQSAIESGNQPLLLTPHPLIAQHLSSLWRRKPTRLAADWPALQRAVDDFARRNVDEFLLLLPPGSVRATRKLASLCRLDYQHRGRFVHYFDLDLLACKMPSLGSRPRGDRPGGRRRRPN